MDDQERSVGEKSEEQVRPTSPITRREFIRIASAVVGGAIIGSAVTACAAPATPTTVAAPPVAVSTAAPATAVVAGATATAVPAPLKTKLILAQGIDPRSLWASNSTAQQEINVSEQINEKLIEFTADSADFEPRLATEWKQLDDTTLQMKLRQGVQFTNGEAFDSASAKFSIETMLKSTAYVAFTTMIAGAEIVDKYTINIKLKYPTLLHLLALAMGSFQYPVDHLTKLGPDEFGKKPIGTGPYKFVEWVKDSQITLEANDKYWGGTPPMKTVVFRNIPEGAAKMAALETGEVDFIIDVPLDGIERIEKNANLQLFSRPSNRLFALTPSTLTNTALKNPLVRQALAYAIDVNALVQALFKGRAKPLAGQNLAPGYFGYDPARKPTPYDPEKAKKMIADAGYPNGFDIVFKYSSGRYAQDKEAGQAIAAQLAKVGIRAKQEVLESGTFLTQLSALQLNDLFFSGSLPPPDASFLYQSYETGFRYAYYSNPKLDALLQKGRSTANKEERVKVYKDILDLCDQDPPTIPLYQPEDFYAGSKKVSGFAPRGTQFLDVRSIKVTQ